RGKHSDVFLLYRVGHPYCPPYEAAMRYTFTPRFGSPAGRVETPRTGSDRVLHGEHHLAPSSHLKAVLHKSPRGAWRWSSTEHASPAPLVRSMICVDSGSQVSCLLSS